LIQVVFSTINTTSNAETIHLLGKLKRNLKLLLSYANSFQPDSLLGEGGFDCVFIIVIIIR
jgi:hypothetical protein